MVQEQLSSEELKREKAKRLRYKKPMVKEFNLMDIWQTLEEIDEACYEVEYWDDDNLLAAFGDDEEDEWEFKMEFSALSSDAERFRHDLEERTGWRDEEYNELVNNIMVGIAAGGQSEDSYLGYDSYEQDYYGLDYPVQFLQGDAVKKLKRKTKDQIIDDFAYVFKIMIEYVGIKNRYDNLKSALDIVRGEHMTLIKEIKDIESMYEDCHFEDGFMCSHSEERTRFDLALSHLPQEAWIQ